MNLERIFYGIYSSPMGRIYSYSDGYKIIYADFHEWMNLKSGIGLYKLERDDSVFSDLFIQFNEYFSGERSSFDIPFEFRYGTDFQKRVWHEIQKIPYGQTRSYRDISLAIGKGGAFRAVGRCCKMNPLILIVPCHRVIRENGMIGNYKGGIERKIFLLQLEEQNRGFNKII